MPKSGRCSGDADDQRSMPSDVPAPLRPMVALRSLSRRCRGSPQRGIACVRSGWSTAPSGQFAVSDPWTTGWMRARICARSAVDPVPSDAAVQLVVTLFTEDVVVTATSSDDVRVIEERKTAGSAQMVVVPVAEDHVRTTGPKHVLHVNQGDPGTWGLVPGPPRSPDPRRRSTLTGELLKSVMTRTDRVRPPAPSTLLWPEPVRRARVSGNP